MRALLLLRCGDGAVPGNHDQLMGLLGVAKPSLRYGAGCAPHCLFVVLNTTHTRTAHGHLLFSRAALPFFLDAFQYSQLGMCGGRASGPSSTISSHRYLQVQRLELG